MGRGLEGPSQDTKQQGLKVTAVLKRTRDTRPIIPRASQPRGWVPSPPVLHWPLALPLGANISACLLATSASSQASQRLILSRRALPAPGKCKPSAAGTGPSKGKGRQRKRLWGWLQGGAAARAAWADPTVDVRGVRGRLLPGLPSRNKGGERGTAVEHLPFTCPQPGFRHGCGIGSSLPPRRGGANGGTRLS